MIQETHHDLFEKGLLTHDQFDKIEMVESGKLFSVYYELRSILYLGVLLFTTGVGILVYINIGDLGHVIAIGALILLTLIAFIYVFRYGGAYSNEPVKGPTPYFDYVTLLASLLFISVLGYLQFQFGLLDDNLGETTLVTAALFFYIAYRFDHLGVLSLAITALASFWSISITPQKWYSGNFFSAESNLHVTAIIFGAAIISIALLLDYKSIKKHFTFTYLNFSSLIFFAGSIAGLFIGDYWGIFLLLIYAGCAFAWYMARRTRSFIFLLYAFIAGYIGTTYFLAVTIFRNASEIWFLYSIISCGGFIYFVVRYKNYFTRKS